MVGDSIERDMEPAKKLGLRTALAKYGQIGIGTSDFIDYELCAFSDLLKIIQFSLKIQNDLPLVGTWILEKTINTLIFRVMLCDIKTWS